MTKTAFLPKQKYTRPSRHTLCVMLAGGDHKAGIFLLSILHWSKYATATVSGTKGPWIANTRSWWMRECCLTASQYDRTISKLEQMSLIEKRQALFWGRNVLHLRLTPTVRDYLASATTWAAADQFVPVVQTKFLKCENVSSSNSAISNELDVSDEPGSPEISISSIISNNNDDPEYKLECAHSASPQCAQETMVQINLGKSPGETTNCSGIHILKLDKVANDWMTALKQRYAEKIEAGEFKPELTPKDLGDLALIESGFSQFIADLVADPTSQLKPTHDYEQCFCSFLASVIEQWPTIQVYKKPLYPSLTFLTEQWDQFIPTWSSEEH